MNHPAPISRSVTVELDEETAALLEKVAAAQSMSEAAFAAEAIRRVAESEADFLAFIQVGIDAADRGDLTPHAEVFENLRRRRQHRDAA
uniref:CopG family ribbon-helix-helix protein n=1 Tax=uncultured Sphingomonas sp. TaxID=158754 RepID=UPI0035CA2B5B